MKHGKLEFIRSDNGPEFISMHLQDLLKRVGIQPLLIYPGSPWENGYNERFNGTLRREVLNAEWFQTTKQAQIAMNAWLRQCNQIRSHHVLGMRPPFPETVLEETKINGTEKGARHLHKCKIQMQVTVVACPRNQQDPTNTAIHLDGGFFAW